MSRRNVTYHIIGGGIAGLAAARFVKQKNHKNKVILYEASHKLGGRCFSFFDPKLDRQIDNATHVVLGANALVKQLLGDVSFDKMPHFWSEGKASAKFWKFKDIILRSVFNTQSEKVASTLLRNLLIKLFPFFPYKMKVYYSKGDLTSRLIDPLSRYLDELKLDYILQGYESNKKTITSLTFNKEKIAIEKKDKIICALDASNYCKIFNGPEFDFNEICNIFFRTSTELTLPDKLNYLATPENIGDWIFISDNITAVTISDSAKLDLEDDDLARKIWAEIRATRGLKPAFLPPYRVFRYKQATICQDEENNKKRPRSAKSEFKNMKIAGDWTMKKYPCSLEAAVLSAKRATS